MKNRIILSAPKHFHLLKAKDQFFTPTEEQVNQAEASLGAYLKVKYAKLQAKHSQYFRQYVGVVGRDGHKKIYGNYFCKVTSEVWKSEWLKTRDGGDCYFDFTYDMESLKIIQLNVNGEA